MRDMEEPCIAITDLRLNDVGEYNRARYGGFSYLLRSDFDQAIAHDRGQLEFRRIDSPVLLPVRGRCLTKMLPIPKGWAGNEEATEHGSKAGTDRSSR